MRPLLLAACLCLLPQIALAQGSAIFPALPPGPGRDVMVSVCANCHTPEIAAQQNHDVAGWKGILKEMQANGADFTPAEGDAIATYLSTAFPKK
jgi:mono/diheme cytochrome c family protein